MYLEGENLLFRSESIIYNLLYIKTLNTTVILWGNGQNKFRSLTYCIKYNTMQITVTSTDVES